MKNFLLISFASVLVALFCGSINDWSEKYYAAGDDAQRFDALKFIHCQPVVDQFTGDSTDVSTLDKMLVDALQNKETVKGPDKYVINLVFKNYVRFKLASYDNLSVTQELASAAGLTEKELRRLIKSIPKDAMIRKDDNLGMPHEAYAEQIAQEINEVVN